MIEWRVMRRDEEGLIRVILVLRVQGWTDSGIDPIWPGSRLWGGAACRRPDLVTGTIKGWVEIFIVKILKIQQIQTYSVSKVAGVRTTAFQAFLSPVKVPSVFRTTISVLTVCTVFNSNLPFGRLHTTLESKNIPDHGPIHPASSHGRTTIGDPSHLVLGIYHSKVPLM